MEQRTEEWFQARLGKVTASAVADMMAKTKTGAASADRANLLARLLTERLTGEPTVGFTNAAMQWGVDTEDQARAAVAFEIGEAIEEVGFVDHPEIEGLGASPDGLIGTDGLVEIKCPNTATHIDTLLSQKVAKKYLLQMQTQLACTGRQWCLFASYDPRLPQHLQLWTTKVARDPVLIKEIETETKKFLAELEDKIEKLNEQFGVKNGQ
jgi:putative phage-type endonuclease